MRNDIIGKEISTLSAKDILFFVGAGISKNLPSNIPLGDELIKFILDIVCGKDESKVFINTWEEFSDEIKKYDSSLSFPIPRLETILGCIDELDTILSRKSILSGIADWANVPPNNNHYILSKFLNEGSNIITTNFDLGIENAYKNHFGPLKHQTVDGLSIFSNINTGNICHVHGCAIDEIGQLGATIKRVKNGFSEKIETLLRKTINKSKLIIFVGYSISDSFDITPFFQNIYGTNILFIQHTINTDSTISFPANLEKIASHSSKLFKIGNNTTDFLKDLSSNILKNKTFLSSVSNVKFDWTNGFLNKISTYNKHDQILNFLSLRYHLGISTDIFIKNRPTILTEITDTYTAINNKNPRIEDYYKQATRSFTQLKADKITYPKLIIQCKEKYINKEHLVILKDECEYFIDKYSDLQLPISKTDYLRMEWLLNLLNDYSLYTFKDVQYISYIIASLKYASAFSALIKKECHPEYAQNELILALDISYIEGTIAALVHLAQHYIISDHISQNSQTHIKQTVNALSTATKLAKISGYLYHIERIKRIIESNKFNFDI